MRERILCISSFLDFSYSAREFLAQHPVIRNRNCLYCLIQSKAGFQLSCHVAQRERKLRAHLISPSPCGSARDKEHNGKSEHANYNGDYCRVRLRDVEVE